MKNWVRVALLLLPEVIIVGLLFFIAVNLKDKTKEINVQVHCPGEEKIIWSEKYE